MAIISWIILAVVVLIVLWIIGAFNGLVTLKNRAKEAWADIDVQLKRRYDLIPNLVETVKGYASHEKEVFEKVTQARASAMNAQGTAQKAEAENALSGTLKSLFAVAESYPDLKASQNFMELQKSLADIEDQVQLARRYYNGAARNFNILIQSFPSNLMASTFGFTTVEYFEIEAAAERAVPKVAFP